MGDFCSFCGKNESSVEGLVRGGGKQPGGALPPVAICNECVALASDILSRPALQEPASSDAVTWQSFVVHGKAYEWCCVQVQAGSEPKQLLQVRPRGEERKAVAIVLGADEQPEFEDAVTAVRTMILNEPP